jgi:hypothetical protein
MFGKKEATPEDVAGGLKVFLKIDAQTFEAINNISSDPNIQEKICFEIFLLKLFSIDFSLHSTIGDIKEKAAIMDHLMVNFIKDVPNGNPMDFIDYANKRQFEYARALETPHDLGIPFMIGKKFCEFIYNKPDASLAFLGSVEFTTTCKKMHDFMGKILKKYKLSL